MTINIITIRSSLVELLNENTLNDRSPIQEKIVQEMYRRRYIDINFQNYNFKYQDKTDVNFLDMIKYYKFNSKSMCFFAVKQN